MESNYNLREEDIKEGIRLCYQKVNSLLDNAETILTQRGDREIGSGLYTYAVEELGKLLLLQDSLKQKKNSDGTITIDLDIFGKGNEGGHTKKKFNRFRKNSTIPERCKKLRYVKGGVSTGSSFTALFGIRPVDFLLRKQILYTDWVRKKWLRHLDIEISDLQSAITELRKWMTDNITV